MKKLLLLLLCLPVSVSFVFAQEDEVPQEIKAMWTITAKDCQQHVNVLASEEFAGRGTGRSDFYKTADYIAGQFGDMGLSKAVGDTSFLQNFYTDYNAISNSELALISLFKKKGKYDTLTITYKLDRDFMPLGSAGECDFTGDVVFAGFGIKAPENKWNDYKKINVKDKVVFVLSGAPQIDGLNFGRLSRSRNKVKFAQEEGAKAVLVISDPFATISYKTSIPTAVVSEKVANNFFAGTGYTVEKIKQEIESTKKSKSIKLEQKIKFKVESELLKQQKTANIIGILEGSDPVLKNEYLVLGAHADHLGKIGNLTFYGANDNASGASVVMEIAQAFCSLKDRPKRSVIFMAFSGEEMGLLGSHYYTDHPIFPIEDTKAMINLDMVGYGRLGIMLVGGHTFPTFTEMFEKYSDKYAYTPIKRRWTSHNSDHYPFHEKGIPALFLYAFNGPPTYHTIRDTADTLDPEVMETVGRLTFAVLYDLANAETVDFPLVENKEQ